MDINKAIEKVKDKYEGWMGYARSQKEFNELEIERDKVISLLQQGEKYKHMWQSIKSAKINDKTIQKAIRILIKDIEEGYKK